MAVYEDYDVAGSIMDEEWGMSLGSEYVPSETRASTEDTVSMVDESCEPVGGSGSEDDDAEEEGRGLRGVALVTVRGRSTLEKICKFNKTLEPYQKEAIEGTILKSILEYRPFSMQKELTAALVKAWVPRWRASRLAGRLVPFSVYDIALFTGLPVTGKRVEFDEDDLCSTELARMVGLRMAQYVTEKSDNLNSEKGRKKPVFRNYIKVMKKLMDTNKEPEKLGLWLSLCGSTSTQQGLRNMTRAGFLGWQVGIVSTIGKGVLSYEEHLKRTHEELRAEKGKHVDILRMLEFWKSRANELEARLKVCAVPSQPHHIRHQPGGDVGVHVQSESGLESLAKAVNDLGEATEHDFSAVKGGKEDATCPIIEHIPGVSSDGQNTPTRIIDAATLLDGCHDVIQLQGRVLARHPHLQWQMWKVVYLARQGVDYEATLDPAMQFVHVQPMVADSGSADEKACVEPPLGVSVHRGDGSGKSSNIVTCMKRKPRCWKPTAVHGTPFADLTHIPGARKRQKEMKEGMIGANKPRAAGDPCEGNVHPFVVDVQPLSVEGSGIGSSVEELNKLKLTKQVLAGYISAFLSATEMELVTNVRSRLQGIRPNARLWKEDLQEFLQKLVPASWLWGLINVVPKAGAMDISRKYCIGNLTMDMFTELLQRRQWTYPNLCWMSVFLKHHTSVTLHSKGRISSIIWDSFKPSLSRMYAMFASPALLTLCIGRGFVWCSVADKVYWLETNVDWDIAMCSVSKNLYGGIDVLHRTLRLAYGEPGIVSELHRDMNMGDGLDLSQYQLSIQISYSHVTHTLCDKCLRHEHLLSCTWLGSLSNQRHFVGACNAV
ncbi:hypothetical protein Cgig2_010916 [Carnegiea gigantea]|uniref:Uncharacterized protein n=1 Tax=Carnegiea gigantea TaxID=171969 RepID=A0A9Q1QBA3_9CARY|nr:hypothetical protein Cgig2_010916 [Carnegiea gigantea]